MKIFLYSFLCASALFFIGFVFMAVTTPNVPQVTVTKTLDPKTAFTPSKTPAATPVMPVSHPESAVMTIAPSLQNSSEE